MIGLLDPVFYRIFEELCEHDELLRDFIVAQSAILSTARELVPDFEDRYAKHYAVAVNSEVTAAFDRHMVAMQQLRDELRAKLDQSPGQKS